MVSNVLESQARAAFDRGDFPRCIELCREALARSPEEGELWQLCGTACWELGLLDDAQEVLESASCLKPLSPLAQLSLAEVYTRTRHLESARSAASDLADREDCPVSLLPRVARSLGQLGEFSLALSVCERLVVLRPFHHAAVFGVAFYRSALGQRPEQILPWLMRAFELAPDVISYRVSLASVLAGLQRSREAYDLVREVPPHIVTCRVVLQRLLPVFLDVGDHTAYAAWQARLTPMRGCD